MKEQDEVRDIVAHETVPERLVSTVVFAACLPHLICNLGRTDRRLTMHKLYVNPGTIFLELWEEFIYPVLRDDRNESWASRWRGGHITNDIEQAYP